jgi:hypothetical protein
LRFIELGLAPAILAGVQQERILNFMNREELAEMGFEHSRRAK